MHKKSEIRDLKSEMKGYMATVSLIEYENAAPEVRAVFDDIKRTRNVEDVNNFGRRWRIIPRR